jgi:hypothetical protein
VVSEHADLWRALAEPFPPHRIGQLKKGGMTLSYITARVVQERLDEVLGAENWRCSFREWREHDTICRLEVRVAGEWIAKEDGADEADISSTKSGFSGSFKRAAVMFGIGRSLYPETPWTDEPPRSPSPAASPPSRPKPAPKAKAQQAKPQAVSEPSDVPIPLPEWWGEETKLGMDYFDLTWADAWDRHGYDFLGYCQSVVEEIRAALANSKKKPTPNDMRLKAAVAYMESHA